METRQVLFNQTKNEKVNWSYFNALTDITAIYSHKLGYNNALAGGYMVRFREGEIGHRSIQQFTIVQRLEGYRLSHRFSTDQTWMPNDPIALRIRYRLASEIPLQGSSLDPKEFYIKASTEYLSQLQDNIVEHEVRLIPVLGYDFTDNNKLEAGLDYRRSSLFTESLRARYWLKIAWFRTF